MKLLIALIIPFSVLCTTTKELQADIEHLTNILFANLEGDLQFKNASLRESKEFVDKQVANYMALMKTTHDLIEHSLTRRSLPIHDITTLTKDNLGIHVLDGVVPLYSMNIEFPKDIHIFRNDHDWYAAVLESNNVNDYLAIYQLDGNKYSEVTRTPVVNGVKLGLSPLSDGFCIIVAEYNKVSENIHEKTKVLYFAPSTRSLTKIQHLDAEYASDVAIWNEHKKIFMVVTTFKRNEGDLYEVEIPIYQWLGRHFDIFTTIKTYGTKKIFPFFLEHSHFLAVANFQNNFGKTNIYSELFKYNRHNNKFESHQKILTKAAVDVKYFHVSGEQGTEHFLIFANSFEEDENGTRNYETSSIVYKYVEGYFIPFQSIKVNFVTEWLPIMGAQGEFALFAASKRDGIKIFQYDGWKFTESKVQYTEDAFAKGVASMRAYTFDNKTVIAVANENDRGNMDNIFEVKFSNKKMLSQFHDDNLQWCQENLEKYTTAHKLVKRNDGFNEKLSKLQHELREYEKEIEMIEKQLNYTGDNVVHGDLHINNLTLEDTISRPKSIFIESINNEKTSEFLANVININHDFVVEHSFDLENVVTSEISPSYINTHPVSSMVSRNNKEHLRGLIVNGDVVFQKGLLLRGKLNGINFTRDNVLLKQGNQTMRSLDLNMLEAELLDTDFINDIDMSQSDSAKNQPKVLETLNTLNAKTVDIKGLMNNVDIFYLKEFALRTHGNQTITGKYKFDSLIVDHFTASNISGKQLRDELVSIDEGEYVLNQSAEFLNTFTADTVVLSDSFNHMRVINGDLDVLLTNSTEVQHVTGFKEFGEIELMNPIKLGGRINNPKIDQMNPVKITNEEITITGDYTIAGDFEIKNFLQALDVQSSSVSVANLQVNGIKLSDGKISCHLQFLQQLNVPELFVDTINGVLVDSFVVMGSDEEQLITGLKTFPGDVFVTDNTYLEYVNGIHIPTLESDVLKITGEQTITGNHEFEKIVANRVANVRTVFGDRPWEKVIEVRPDQVIPGTTVITGTLQLDELEADSLTLFPNSLVNGYNFTFMIEDSVFRNDTIYINGATEFSNLLILNLYADNLDLSVIPRIINQSTAAVQFDTNIDIPSRISIEEVYFTDTLNGMHSKDFEDHWLSNGDEQIFRGDQTFNKIVIFGNLFVESGFINNVNISYVSEESVKVDEDHYFPMATFTNGLASSYGVTLDGQFESLDLNDVVLSHVKNVQVIVDDLTFKSDVVVQGEVIFKGLISGVSLSKFCEFANIEDRKIRKMQINGNAYFAKGPAINVINQIPIRHLLETIWFTNQDCIVSAEMEFENAVFQEDLVVHGFVDEVKIQLIAQTYFSKTRDQNISALYNFDEAVVFGSGIYAQRAVVRGSVGDINLGEFVTTALLNNYEQVFESALYLEECEIRELMGEYLVNDLNLQSDVMRYDQNNVVAGRKIILGVKSHTLKIDKNVHVQNVNLIPWMHDSVLKSGSFQLKGKVSFFNETTFSQGIGCQENVNGIKFNDETLMLRSKPQTITERKNFLENNNRMIKFGSLIVKGRINGVDMNELLRLQAYKNGDVVFQSPVYFNGSIAAPAVQVEKLYQGVNVSDLVNTAAQLSKSHNYTENFERLLKVSSEVKSSLQAHAYFINYYRVKQIYQNIDIVIPVSFSNDGDQYLACITKENRKYTIKFDVWDANTEVFHRAVDISPISAPSNLRYIKEIKFRGADHWYIEHEKTTLRAMYDKYEGSIFEITRSGLQQIVPAILHNGTQYVSSMDLPLLNKCVFLLFSSSAFIYCQSLAASGSNTKYWNPFQEIETFNSVEGTVTTVNNVTYIFILNGGTLNEPSSADVWKFDLSSKLFQKEQSIYVPYPTSISTIRYKNYNFFAVASGYMQSSKYEGMITIRKYDDTQQQYVKWQDIRLNVPIQVLFAELPTQELILYVSTNNPTQPLIMYQYEGISKFTRKIVATTIPHSSFIKSFNTPDLRHFVLTQSGNETNVIEAIFKGQAKHNVK